MIPEREREALIRLTMCAREECVMCKYKDTCDFDFQYETATKCMNILADALNADRETEPSIDIEPKQGKWIDAEIRHEDGVLPIQVCSECKTFYPLEYTGGGHHFCPNCGASMREREGE